MINRVFYTGVNLVSKYLDLENMLVLISLWVLCRVTSEIVSSYNVKSLTIIPFFIFFLSILLIGRKIAQYISWLSKNDKAKYLYELKIINRVGIYMILGFFTVWVTWIITASLTSMSRLLVPVILIIFTMLPRAERAQRLLPWIKNFFNAKKRIFSSNRFSRNTIYIFLLGLQLIFIVLSFIDLSFIPFTVRSKYLSSLLDYSSYTAYLIPLIITISVILGLTYKTPGLFSILVTVSYLSLIPSVRGFTHFGTDVYSTLYATLALIEDIPEVNIFTFTSGKYGYMYWYVLPSNAALMSLISGLTLNFYAIEASLVLSVFPTLIGVTSLLNLLLKDWRLINFSLILLFLINFEFLKKLWWLVPYCFMLGLFFITLSALVLYESKKISVFIMVTSLIITSLCHPIGMILTIVSLIIFKADWIKQVLLDKRFLLAILVFSILLLSTLIVGKQDLFMRLLYSLGLLHLVERNIEFKLSFQNSILTQLLSSSSFYIVWFTILILSLYSIFYAKIKRKVITEERSNDKTISKVVLLTIVLFFGYILSDFIFTRNYLGFDAYRPYLLATTFSIFSAFTFFDRIHRKNGVHASFRIFNRKNLKLKITGNINYCIALLLLIIILASYTIVLYNQNLTLAPKENLSYLYVDEVKLLKGFLDRREYDDALILSYPEVLAYCRSFIPIINWWEIKGFPVIFPDSEKYGAFGGTRYWQTYNSFIKYGDISQVRTHAMERGANEKLAYIIFLYRLAGSYVSKYKGYGRVLLENDAGFVLELSLNKNQVNMTD